MIYSADRKAGLGRGQQQDGLLAGKVALEHSMACHDCLVRVERSP